MRLGRRNEARCCALRNKILTIFFNRKWWWVTVVVFLVMAGLARLGFWQLDRLDERRAENVLLQAALDAPAFELTSEFVIDNPDELKDRWVTAVGEYDFNYQGIIKLQNFQGRAGVFLVAPLILDDGTAVLVNRGWLPVNETDFAQFDLNGEVSVEGFVALDEKLSRSNGGSGSEDTAVLEWFRVDIGRIEQSIPHKLLPIFIIESSQETGELPIQMAREIDLSEGSHLSYAIQWFLFSLILGGGYVLYVRKNG